MLDKIKYPSPVVSIIIATYNREIFLREAIASVLEQSYRNFELIIIDDGSTDNTKAMIDEFNDPRVHYQYQANKGRSVARNLGLRLSTGKYIAFLDSDDLYLPEKLRLQVEYLEKHTNVDMIYTSAYCIDTNGNLLPHHYHATVSGSIYHKIAYFVPVTITLPTVMVKREIIMKLDGFDERMSRFEDTDMWRRIAKISCIDAINIYTCKLRTHQENHLRAQHPQQLVSDLHYYVKKMLQDNKEDHITLNKGIGRLYLHYAAALINIGSMASYGYELLKVAIHYWPWYRFSRTVAILYIKRLYRRTLLRREVN